MDTTCDECKRLRAKCCWDQCSSFKPRCLRCDQYDLPCKVEKATWTARAQRHFMSTLPTSSSKAFYWGLTSIAGGHPTELHGSTAPPAPFIRPHARPPSPTNRHSTCISGRIHLDVDESVRSHLYKVYFDHIAPVWPVLRQSDISQRRPPPLLDCAILGTAARHHTAIVSWRDWVHIQRVLSCELRWLFNIRKPYLPDIETLQGLLIICLRLELSCQSHVDMMSIPIRLSLMCQMAQDLGIQNHHSADLNAAEALQSRNMWFACLLQDAYLSAMFGQTMSITLADLDSTLTDIEEAMKDPQCSKFFLHAVRQSFCLRLVLANGTQIGSRKARPHDLPANDLDHFLSRLLNDIDMLDKAQSHALQMMWRNNQLLHISQSTTTEDSWGGFLPRHGAAGAVTAVQNACETLIWCTEEFQRSTAAQLYIWLYCATRALMLVVDVSLCRKQGTILSDTFDVEIEQAITSARSLRDRLLEDTSWGLHWIQGHAITAVLRRVEDRITQRVIPPGVLKIVSLCDNPQQDWTPTSQNAQQPRADVETHFSEAFSCASDWTTIFRQYDSEYNWLLDEAPLQI